MTPIPMARVGMARLKGIRSILSDVCQRDETMSRITEIGAMNVAQAREHEDVIEEIATILELGVKYIRKTLGASHGKVMIKNLFHENWPDCFDASVLAGYTVSGARKYGLIEELRSVTGLGVKRLNKAIEDANGHMLLKNLFRDQWPEQSAKDGLETGDDWSEKEEDSDDETEEAGDSTITYGTQGGEEHQALQRSICQIGEMKNFHVRTNYDIGAGLKPDVLWFKLQPEKNNGPALVVEIERGSSAALQKSLSSLKHANDRWPGTQLRLIVPKKRREAVEEKLTGAFHEIRANLKISAIEECRDRDHYILAKTLDLINRLHA